MRFSSPEYSFHQSLRSKSLEPNNMDDNKPKIKVPNYSTPVYRPEGLNNESKITKNQEPCTNKSIDRKDNQNYYNIRERTTPPTNQRTWPMPNDTNRPLPNNRVVPTPPMNNDTNRPLPNNRAVPTPPMNPNMPPGNPDEFNNPNFNLPSFENPYNLYSPPYNGPVGVPLMPLYGYDNSEDADKDWEYIRQMYPNTAKRILKEVENECDKLEYNGSCMFDEYPDKVYIGRIIDRIYQKMQDHIDGPIVYAENISPSLPCKEENEKIKDLVEEDEKIDDKIEKNEKDIEVKQYNRNRHRHNHQNQKTNWLKDLIEILFYQEMLNRRRRYRSRNRWF